MNKNALDVVLRLHHKGRSLITNPRLMLQANALHDPDSLAKRRTTFIDFHRYMFSKSDMEIQQLEKAYFRVFLKNRRTWGHSAGIEYCLLNDAIDYQICIRSGDQYVIDCVSEEIAMNWWCNVGLAEQASAVTSEVLIGLARSLTSPN